MGSTAAATAEAAKPEAEQRVDAHVGALVDLSHTIHAHPELGFEEVRASAWVGEALAGAGYSVDPGVCELPTSLVATAGSGPLVIAICAEYDALPGIGHACGHNIIASAAVGAGMALAPLADDLGITVKVMGTPAEEGGGGKILMLERGAFEGVNAAMMVHPAPLEAHEMPCLAVSHFDVHYRGKAAHASAFPEQGINAADALTVAQVSIGLLRQHLRRRDQIHGIVTVGGEAPNVVPEHSVAKYYARAATIADLDVLEPRVRSCFEAGAVATGAKLEIVPQSPRYSHFEPDEAMMRAFVSNAEALG
ncbi:MAG: amidohydrolase, partial [Acidimicrobiales bacterium]